MVYLLTFFVYKGVFTLVVSGFLLLLQTEEIGCWKSSLHYELKKRLWVENIERKHGEKKKKQYDNAGRQEMKIKGLHLTLWKDWLCDCVSFPPNHPVLLNLTPTMEPSSSNSREDSNVDKPEFLSFSLITHQSKHIKYRVTTLLIKHNTILE